MEKATKIILRAELRRTTSKYKQGKVDKLCVHKETRLLCNGNEDFFVDTSFSLISVFQR